MPPLYSIWRAYIWRSVPADYLGLLNPGHTHLPGREPCYLRSPPRYSWIWFWDSVPPPLSSPGTRPRFRGHLSDLMTKDLGTRARITPIGYPDPQLSREVRPHATFYLYGFTSSCRGPPRHPDEPASHRRPLLTLTGNPRGFEMPLEFPRSYQEQPTTLPGW